MLADDKQEILFKCSLVSCPPGVVEDEVEVVGVDTRVQSRDDVDGREVVRGA